MSLPFTLPYQEADKQLGESAHEISKLSKQLVHSLAKTSSLKKELESLQEGYKQEKNDHQKTLESLDSLRESHSAAMEEHCRFMSLLYEQLRLNANSVSSISPDSDVDPGSLQPLTSTPLHQSIPLSDWSKLSEAVSTATLALCEAFKRSKQEAKGMKVTISKLKTTLESTRIAQKENICRLTLKNEEQENQWRQRYEKMKAQFEELLVKADKKAQSLQQRLESVSKAMVQLEQSKNQLESRFDHLQETHRVYKNDRACLLSCTCLMAGALFPALLQLQTLTLQRSILHKQVLESQKLRSSVIEVVKSIEAHIGKHVPTDTQSDTGDDKRAQPCASALPLLKFRKVAIAVIAARRLQMIRREKQVLFRTKFPSTGHMMCQIPVHLGIRERRTPNVSPRTTSSSSTSYPQKMLDSTSRDLAGWMRSEKALLEVRESFTNLQSLLDACTTQQQKQHQYLKPKHTRGHGLKKDNAPQKVTAVVRPARSAFEALLTKMIDHFPDSKDSSTSSIICGDGVLYLRLQPQSLISRLAQGLHKILENKPHPLPYYVGSSEVSTLVQSCMYH